MVHEVCTGGLPERTNHCNEGSRRCAAVDEKPDKCWCRSSPNISRHFASAADVHLSTDCARSFDRSVGRATRPGGIDGEEPEAFEKMADPDIFTWLQSHTEPKRSEVHRAATIVADRLCGSAADPIIRNAQEAR